ncbi:TonB-dependent receptor [Siccirubricoccus deserti]|uniref:TonB-dependent receptor n=1 Tax=Siccirubricoccus deserti TaxID=2013562 RepID=A0A9X0QV77_9PROT|nr:TonB-dependent receptor [Siccirubricoccus deserti]MBC4014519.1 TonB-dependent receptor [Siccirubricoccus deserti]GGC32283.1 TonB-dependent receptor [Siccirubricoccus deserti]
MRAAAVILGMALAGPAMAQTATLPPLLVTAPPPAAEASASEHQVPREEIAARPIARTGEVLEAAPGLVVTQHSGEGKANQYFLRGFNLDHGTDLAIRLDGMPLNMRSHAHGQGYADLNFLIPELLDGIHVRKGPYFADEGDFATAGALRLDLINRLDRPLVQGTVGSFGYWRGLAAGSMALGAGTLLGAGEAASYDGPWQRPEALVRLNGLLRYSQGTARDGFTLTGMAYNGHWRATDQVPARAVSAGNLDRFGTLDPTDGGRSQRFSLSGRWATTGDFGTTSVSAYAIRSTLDLYSNFTYVLDDPVNGDQFLQRDRRWVLGGEVAHAIPWTAFGRAAETRFGVQIRHDDIRLGLFRTASRALLSPVREDALRQDSVGFFTDTVIRPIGWMRLTGGLRADWMGGRVNSGTAANSGSAGEWIASPKAGIVFGPWWATEVFLNAGTGFHSNDLRGATIRVDPTDRLTPLSRVPLLVRAKGAEVGIATSAVPGLDSRLAVFVLTLGSEILFVGDAGTTEAGRPSRRIGIEWTNHWRPKPWLGFDLDMAATRARFTDSDGEGRHIPGAPNLVMSAGVTLDEGLGWFGTARLRHFGARPLAEDNSARSHPTTLVNARIGYRFANGMQASLDVFNLFNTRASQIDYFYASRLPGEPAAGVEDRHFHPAEPFAVRFTLAATL